MTMSARQDFETDAEGSSESSRSTREPGFFARRRARKEALRREKEHAAKRDAHLREGRRARPTVEVLSAGKDARRPVLGTSGPRRIDLEARKELEDLRDRRDFLRKSAIGAGILALGAGIGYSSGYAHATGLSGNTRTVITDNEVAARVIGGVRIATEFIPDPVPAGTDADPYPGSAIQAALNDGLHVYVPAGTWKLSSAISRAADGVTIIGAGRGTKLVFNGTSPCISAGSRNGWLIANIAVDAGGVDVSGAAESRFSEVWVNGTLTDNRPIGSGGSGTGGYYGVRAADFITSGDGSPSNPYNGSAIQAAVDALPSTGGVVFIKEGIWRGATRITVNANGSTPRKRVIFKGSGTMPYQIYNDDSGHNMLTGTHVQAGFDIYHPCDFYDMAISPTNRDKSTDGINFIQDPTKTGNDFTWTQQGCTVKRIRFHQCNTGIRFSGRNMGATFLQIWGVLVEQCGFIQCGQGVRAKVADIDSTAPSQGFRGVFTRNEFRSCNGGRAFDFDFSSSMLEFSNTMLEGCGAPTGDYALYIRTYGDGGITIYNVDFGDGSESPKEAYIWPGRSGYVNNLISESARTGSKPIDIGGRGYFRIGTLSQINLVNAIQVIVEQSPGTGFAIGTIDSASQSNAATICIRRSAAPGHLGSTIPTASPYTYTNLDMTEEMVYLVGGTITGITRNGQSIGTERTHYMRPGDTILISYSSAPTIRRFGVSTG